MPRGVADDVGHALGLDLSHVPVDHHLGLMPQEHVPQLFPALVQAGPCPNSADTAGRPPAWVQNGQPAATIAADQALDRPGPRR